jgi:predicted nucleic acid-binding protein
MARYLLDTNHLSNLIEPVSALRDRLVQAQRRGDVFGICIPVLCEFEAGISQFLNPDPVRRGMERILRRSIRIWPLDRPVATIYGELYVSLKRQGRALSRVDIILAALAKRDRSILLTADRDFEALPEVKTENWLITP